MPFEPSGHWTSPTTGKKYDPYTPREEYDPADLEARDQDEGRWAGDSLDFVGEKLGFVPLTIDENAPGASLNNTGADGQSSRLQAFGDTLSQQAATGDGAWRKRFAEAVWSTQAAAQSLGQSDSNVDPLSARINIGNAQRGAQQRAVNEEGMLRTQAQIDARGQLGSMLGQQAQQDLGQSAETAKVVRERRLANQALLDQSLKNREDTSSGIMGMFGMGGMGGMGGMSDGGKVPGKAKVFGDDERNDTVPAMLSPGEIVIPRSIALRPNADSAAARFVRAVQAKGGARKMAEGGSASGIRRTTHSEGGGEGVFALNFLLPHVGRQVQYDNLRDSVGSGGGGTLDTTQFDRTQAQQDALASMFAQDAAGQGPSMSPYMQQKALDENIASTLAAQQRGAMQADALKSAAASGVDSAADVGRQTAREVSAGQRGYADVVLRRRAQEQAMAQAKQRAAWEKTLADAGLSLANQAQLRNTVSGAGQAIAGLATAGGDNNGGYRSDPNNLASLSNNPYPDSPGSDPGEWNQYPGEGPGDFPTGDSDTQYAARGGVIRKYADGGAVPDYLQPWTYDLFDRAKTVETGVPTFETIEVSAGEPTVTERPTLMHALSKPSAQVIDGKTVVTQKPAPDNRTALDKYADAMAKAGYVLPIAPDESAPEEKAKGGGSAFAKAVRQLSDFAKHAGAATLPSSAWASDVATEAPKAKSSKKARKGESTAEMSPDFEVQRAFGGSIPGYADGGPVYGGYNPGVLAPVGATVAGVDPYAMPERRDSGARTFTGADLGLGGGFSSNATASLPPAEAMPVLPTASATQLRAGRQAGVPTAVGASLAPQAEKTLVEVGKTPDGMPIVESRTVEMVPELKTLKRADSSAAPPAPVARAPEKPKGAAGPGSDSRLDADEQAAVLEKIAAEQAEAAAKAEGAAARANTIETQLTLRRRLEEQSRASVDEARRKYDAAREEMGRIDATVDPGRFWATRSTGDKVLGIIGMALGALGAGRDGINRAAVMLNNAIERDIDAQKAQFGARLQKGRQAVDAAQTFYSMARGAVQDDLAAHDLATAAALDTAAAKAEATVASTGNAKAKAAGDLLAVGLRRGAQEKRQAGWLKARELDIEEKKADAAIGKTATPPGTADRIKMADEVNTVSGNILRNVSKLKGLIAKYGTQEKWAPGVEEDMTLASTEIATELAKMLDPSTGVRDPEMERWSRLIFQPGYLQRESNAVAQLDNLAQAVEARRQNALHVRGMAP